MAIDALWEFNSLEQFASQNNRMGDPSLRGDGSTWHKKTLGELPSQEFESGKLVNLSVLPGCVCVCLRDHTAPALSKILTQTHRGNVHGKDSWVPGGSSTSAEVAGWERCAIQGDYKTPKTAVVGARRPIRPVDTERKAHFAATQAKGTERCPRGRSK